MTTRLLAALLAALASPVLAQRAGDWTMPAHDYAASRYCELAQITPANAASLRAVWTFSTGVLGGHEGQPLVVNNTMYVVTPYPNVLYAFDLTQTGYPAQVEVPPGRRRQRVRRRLLRRGQSRRVLRRRQDRLQPARRTHRGRRRARRERSCGTPGSPTSRDGETIPMAPYVVKDRVIVGASGGEFGIRGWITALDLKTGEVVVDRRTTSAPTPTCSRKPGTFKPFYDKGAELGASTWPTNLWKTGGAPVWGWMSYDPDARSRVLRRRQSRPLQPRAAPRRQQVDDQRPRAPPRATVRSSGPTSSRRTTAGTTTRTGDMILADLVIKGKPRKALVHLRQERLRLHARPRHRRAARRRALRAGELGEADRSRDRTPGGGLEQGDGRVARECQGHLPLARGGEESRVAGGVLAAHRACSTRRRTTSAWTSRR